MTITPEQLYWILKLDDIRELMIPLGIVPLVFGLVALGIGLGVKWIEEAKVPKSVFVLSTIGVVFGFVLLVGRVFIPSTQQYAAIKILPRVINSDFVQKDVPAEAKELYGLCKKWLEGHVGQAQTPEVPSAEAQRDQ